MIVSTHGRNCNCHHCWLSFAIPRALARFDEMFKPPPPSPAAAPPTSPPPPFATLPAGGGWYFMPAGLAAALEALP